MSSNRSTQAGPTCARSARGAESARRGRGGEASTQTWQDGSAAGQLETSPGEHFEASVCFSKGDLTSCGEVASQSWSFDRTASIDAGSVLRRKQAMGKHCSVRSRILTPFLRALPTLTFSLSCVECASCVEFASCVEVWPLREIEGSAASGPPAFC